MNSITAIVAAAGLGLTLAAQTPVARADGWSVAIGVPDGVLMPPGVAYGPPPGYYQPSYPPGYAPSPPYYGRYDGGRTDDLGRDYGPPAWVQGGDEGDDD